MNFRPKDVYEAECIQQLKSCFTNILRETRIVFSDEVMQSHINFKRNCTEIQWKEFETFCELNITPMFTYLQLNVTLNVDIQIPIKFDIDNYDKLLRIFYKRNISSITKPENFAVKCLEQCLYSEEECLDLIQSHKQIIYVDPKIIAPTSRSPRF